MHNLICRWLFFAYLLCLPIGSGANIASKKAIFSTNTTVAEQQSNGQKKSIWGRISILKKLKNTLYTEGGTNTQKDKKNTLARRIFKIILLAAASILLIYWLQGTIGLALVTGGGIAYWLSRDRIAERKRLNRERQYAYKQERKKSGNATSSLSHPANKWTRRALTRFLYGIGLILLALIFFIAALFESLPETIAIFAAALILVGYSFMIASFFNAVKALVTKEPQSVWAWIVVIFNLPLLLILMLGFILSIAG